MSLLKSLLSDDAVDVPALNIQNLTAAGDTINKNPFIELRATSPLIMTSTPTISPGLIDGERMIIRGSDNTNTITLQSEADLASTGLKMKGSPSVSVVLGANDWIVFRWNILTTTWDEITRSLNS